MMLIQRRRHTLLRQHIHHIHHPMFTPYLHNRCQCQCQQVQLLKLLKPTPHQHHTNHTLHHQHTLPQFMTTLQQLLSVPNQHLLQQHQHTKFHLFCQQCQLQKVGTDSIRRYSIVSLLFFIYLYYILVKL